MEKALLYQSGFAVIFFFKNIKQKEENDGYIAVLMLLSIVDT